MAEKFSIVKQFDIEKLNNRISDFRYKNEYKPYVFASSETLAALVRPMEQDLVFTNGKQTKLDGLIAKYQGCKVFEDSTLDFGEIELR